MAAGWMIGVLVHLDGASAPVRCFYAVAQPDRARAEWAAADQAIAEGAIAASPHGGMEPVEAVGAISPDTLASLGLRRDQVRALGWKWPRRWIGSPTVAEP